VGETRADRKISTGENDRMLCRALCHAPLAFNLAGAARGSIGTVLMDKWTPELCLQAIDRYRVTTSHMVPTQFHRLLALPDDVKRRYDLSSLRVLLHGAAPTPVHVKKALIDWLGPIVYEYYAATEGGGTFVTSEEWLGKPGSVGKPADEGNLQVRDDDGRPVPSGTVGTIWFRAPPVGASSTSATRRRRSRATTATGSRCATWAIRTRRAMSSSPAGPRS
jgi:long-chain acyl-CoA synthetase